MLDEDGVVVAVNKAWEEFARDNGGATKSYVGASYVGVCGDASRNGDTQATLILRGLRDILGGRQDRFTLEYPCHSPDQQRWFVARFTRFTHEGRRYVAARHEDVTARKLAELQLQQAEGTLRRVLEALPVGVWIMDRAGTIVLGNEAGQRIWAGARYVGPAQFGEYKGWWLHSGKPIGAEEWAAARAILRGETSLNEEVRIQCFDGSSKIILNSALPLRDGAGAVSGAVIVNQDITASKRAEQDLAAANAALQEGMAREQALARTDVLTGLGNRRHFFDVGAQLFTVAQRYGTPLAAVLFDIDTFKRVNDERGHQAGDAVLRDVARIAREHARDADLLARYGGEEFILLLPNTGAAEALVAAELLRERVAADAAAAEAAGRRVTISAGVAGLAGADDTLDALIRRADEALYAAKRAGRNRSHLAGAAPAGGHEIVAADRKT